MQFVLNAHGSAQEATMFCAFYFRNEGNQKPYVLCSSNGTPLVFDRKQYDHVVAWLKREQEAPQFNVPLDHQLDLAAVSITDDQETPDEAIKQALGIHWKPCCLNEGVPIPARLLPRKTKKRRASSTGLAH